MPLKLLLVFFSILLFSNISAQDSTSVNIRRVVIDPGHGGRDPGAVSPDGKVLEKNITLSVALKLGELIRKNYPYVEVIYTRDRDIAVNLDRRTEIANKSKADLFMSIHVNAARSRAATGSETFIMGQDKSSSNLEVTMLENSVVLLEGDDYQSRYEGFNPNDPESYIIFSLLHNAHQEQSIAMASLIQKHFNNGPIKVNRGIKQGPLLVLWKTGMPSVLIELGFISNANDLKILNDKKNHDVFAQLIFNAFSEYKKQYDRGYNNNRYITPAPVANSEHKEDTISIIRSTISSSLEQTAPPESHYRVQILSVSKLLPANSPDLKGIKEYEYLITGNQYKYTVGRHTTLNQAREALAETRRVFPQAFIIRVQNNNIVPL